MARYRKINSTDWVRTDGLDTNNYSSSEQVIGTWIDGKPIYRKVIESNFQTGTNPSTWVYGPTIPNANRLINCTCTQADMTATYQPTQRAIANNTLQFTFNLPTNRTITLIIAEYTKSTD